MAQSTHSRQTGHIAPAGDQIDPVAAVAQKRIVTIEVNTPGGRTSPTVPITRLGRQSRHLDPVTKPVALKLVR